METIKPKKVKTHLVLEIWILTKLNLFKELVKSSKVSLDLSSPLAKVPHPLVTRCLKLLQTRTTTPTTLTATWPPSSSTSNSNNRLQMRPPTCLWSLHRTMLPELTANQSSLTSRSQSRKLCLNKSPSRRPLLRLWLTSSFTRTTPAIWIAILQSTRTLPQWPKARTTLVVAALPSASRGNLQMLRCQEVIMKKHFPKKSPKRTIDWRSIVAAKLSHFKKRPKNK
jgi:hypothetical protein